MLSVHKEKKLISSKRLFSYENIYGFIRHYLQRYFRSNLNSSSCEQEQGLHLNCCLAIIEKKNSLEEYIHSSHCTGLFSLFIVDNKLFIYGDGMKFVSTLYKNEQLHISLNIFVSMLCKRLVGVSCMYTKNGFVENSFEMNIWFAQSCQKLYVARNFFFFIFCDG